jgi:hypothetical protein
MGTLPAMNPSRKVTVIDKATTRIGIADQRSTQRRKTVAVVISRINRSV